MIFVRRKGEIKISYKYAKFYNKVTYLAMVNHAYEVELEQLQPKTDHMKDNLEYPVKL